MYFGFIHSNCSLNQYGCLLSLVRQCVIWNKHSIVLFLTPSKMASKPRLIVFDLDFTLWPFYVDCSVTPPFRKSNQGDIMDSRQRPINCYKDVPAVLENLYSSGYQLAIASRTGEIEGANQLIHLFGWDKYFAFKEIYPGCKKTHFSRFHEKSGIEYKDMLFFDDENRNITDIRSLGVTCVWVENGINKSLIQQGLKRFYG